MKGVVRSLLLFFCTTLFIMSSVCVVRVHADGATYIVVDHCFSYDLSNESNRYYGVFDYTGNVEVRAIVIQNVSQTRIYFVSDNYFKFNTNDFGSSCPTVVNNEPILTNGYYVAYGSYANYGSSLFSGNVPVIKLNSSITNSDARAMAVSYTWGDNAVDPGIQYGLVDLEGYQTQVTGQGNASINNVDVISWNDTFDTVGNDISSGNVRIRYVPGYYRATSKQNLLAQTYQDFVLDIISAVNGDVYPVSSGSASFRWGDVIGSLSIPFYSIYNLTNSTEGWLKRGWIYEVRLEIDDYIGEWQTVYSSTSSGVENDMTIVNTTVITQETITAIQNINSINGTTNIWIINGQPVDPNPEVTPPADDDEKPWWVYLLEMINNTLGIQNEYINEGTDESIEIVNNFEEDHDDLNLTVNDYDDIENNIVNDMNDNLDDLDIESDLIENNSFLNSASWVATQYTRLTTDNPIGSILKFSLVLGFVMIFLGRFK